MIYSCVYGRFNILIDDTINGVINSLIYALVYCDHNSILPLKFIDFLIWVGEILEFQDISVLWFWFDVDFFGFIHAMLIWGYSI